VNLVIYLYCVVRQFMKEDKCFMIKLVSLADELSYSLFAVGISHSK